MIMTVVDDADHFPPHVHENAAGIGSRIDIRRHQLVLTVRHRDHIPFGCDHSVADRILIAKEIPDRYDR